jgi:capsular polysaccharide biosynthesis protein
MPDLIGLVFKRWKSIAALTIAATLLALIICILLPKEFLSTVTAVPANSSLSDKARLFNNNIEALYPELGTTDELDRIEGTARLDTIYLSVAEKNNLVEHYGINQDEKAMYHAAIKLKKQTDIRRGAYGELKVKVWDKDPMQAANLANAVFNELNSVYQQVQTANNTKVLAQLQSILALKQRSLDSFNQMMSSYEVSNRKVITPSVNLADSVRRGESQNLNTVTTNLTRVRQEIAEYQRIIPQYEMALNTSIQPLIAVENARPSFYPDRPKILLTVILAFAAALVFSVLLAVVTENRKQQL